MEGFITLHNLGKNYNKRKPNEVEKKERGKSMKRYVAIDTGKFATKVAFYDEAKDTYQYYCI